MLTTQNLHTQISWHTCLERALCCGCVNSLSLCSVLMCSCEAAATFRARDLYFLSKVEVGFTLTAPTFHWKSLELKTKFLSLWHGHLLQLSFSFSSFPVSTQSLTRMKILIYEVVLGGGIFQLFAHIPCLLRFVSECSSLKKSKNTVTNHQVPLYVFCNPGPTFCWLLSYFIHSCMWYIYLIMEVYLGAAPIFCVALWLHGLS